MSKVLARRLPTFPAVDLTSIREGDISNYIPRLKLPHHNTWKFVKIIQLYPV